MMSGISGMSGMMGGMRPDPQQMFNRMDKDGSIIGLPWVPSVSSTLQPKEEGHETFQSRQNLDRLPKDPFKKNTVRAYQAIIERFIHEFDDGPVEQVSPEQILKFLNRLSRSNMPPMLPFRKSGTQ